MIVRPDTRDKTHQQAHSSLRSDSFDVRSVLRRLEHICVFAKAEVGYNVEHEPLGQLVNVLGRAPPVALFDMRGVFGFA